MDKIRSFALRGEDAKDVDNLRVVATVTQSSTSARNDRDWWLVACLLLEASLRKVNRFP